MFLPLLTFNLPPQFPIPRIPLQVPVSCRAEGGIRRALGVPLPVTPGRGVPNGRGTNTDGFFHTLPTVTVGAHPQGNHGVHAGIVLNAQMTADILQMGIIGRCRIAGREIRRLERPPANRTGRWISRWMLP